MSQTKVMIVEDERIVAEDIQSSLKNLGYAVSSIVSSGNKAIEDAEKYHPDIVLMDIVLKGEMDGVEAAEQIRIRFNIPIIYLTAYSDEEILERSKITEPFGYIIKPFNDRELHTSIEIALYKYKMERKVKESEQRLSATINGMGEGVIATDEKGIIEILNPFAEALTGWRKEDAIGKSLDEVFNIISEGMVKKVENPVAKVIREGNFYGLAENTFLISKNRIKIPVDISGSLIKDIRDYITGGVFIFVDITERKKAEETRQNNLDLAYANKEKSEFLASMSHELRTPLNAIIGFSDIMIAGIGGNLNETQKGYVEDICNAGNHLLVIIDDILDLSKVEAGKMELIIEEFSVNELLESTINLIKIKAMKHNINIIRDIDSQLEFMEGDKQKIKQVLFNLLSNAVKFSKQNGGTITVAVKKIDGMVRFSVSDTGIGIEKKNLNKLFKEFQQLDSGITRKYGGTGLGLVISKKLVELHGGKMTVESIYGEGSTFAFALPVQLKQNDQDKGSA
ncbi:MAG: ATP-binding protein [Candidatus Methanoperedens sp.]